MPNEPSEIPQFFESIEAIFRTFEVPEDLQPKLLLPFLSVKAKSLISRLSATKLDNYNFVRDFLLSEFKLTPREYKLKFDTATKCSDETYIYFAARLRNNLRYYLRSRDCMDDFDSLFALLVSDKLKSCLSSGALNYVLSLEGQDWFLPSKVAELADTYVSNHSGLEKTKHVNSTSVAGNVSAGSRSPKKQNRFARVPADSNGQQLSRDVICFKCNAAGHIARLCPQNGGSKSESIRRCFRCQSTQHLARNCPKVNEVAVDDGQTDEARIIACFGDINVLDSNFVCCKNETVDCGNADTEESINSCAFDRDDALAGDKANDWEFSDYPRVDAVVTKCGESCVPEIKLSALKFIDITVNGVPCVSLVDSGAEISLLSQQLVSKLGVETCGHIKVRGVFSDPICVPLVSVNVKQCGVEQCENVADGIQLVCAVAPLRDVSHDVVLPLEVVADLERLPVVDVMCINVSDNRDSAYNLNDDGYMMAEVDASIDDDDSSNDNADDAVINADQLMSNDSECGSDELMKAQLDDDSLQSCWEMAKINKGNFIIDHGLLYHCDQVEGQRVCQLCVPKYKRVTVMQMAHESVLAAI